MAQHRRTAVALRLLVRGLVHRRGIAALILIVATVASAAAAVAPMYNRSASISAMRSRLVSAPPQESGVEVAGAANPGGGPDQALQRIVGRIPLASGEIRQLSVGGTTTQLQVKTGPVQFANINWRQDQCAHVHFVQGRCPTAPNEMALPVEAARALDASVGGSIVASNLDRPQFGTDTSILDQPQPRSKLSVPQLNAYELDDTVSGVFTVPPGQDSYWFGQDITAPVVGVDGSQVSLVTALVPYAQLAKLPVPFRATVTVDQPIDWSNASPQDVTHVLNIVRSLKGRLTENLSVFTNIPTLAAENRTDSHQLSHLVTLAQLQLLLLVGLVLISVLASSMDRRRAELVIATLQGRRPIATAISTAAEPVLLLAIGVVPGLLLSLPLAHLAQHLWLRPGTPVTMPVSSVVAAIVVAAVAALVTITIGTVAASRPLTDQLAEDARSAAGRAAAWLDVIAITLAVAGLVELVQTHSNTTSTPWSLLAPSLCGLAAGLGLGRLVPFLLRPLITATSESTNLSGFLALRELRRDRAAWRVTAMVALALSLLTFAVTVSHGAKADRRDRAGLIVGAPQVLDVSVPPNVSLIDAVDRADPHGRWAMAARLIEPFGSASTRNLSIDTSRLANVAGWTRDIAGYSPARLHHLLHVDATFATSGLPVLATPDVDGIVYALDNEPLNQLDVHAASVLPVVLNHGSLTDLQSLIAAGGTIPESKLGTTQIIDQVWLGNRAPADAIKLLEAQRLTVTSITDQSVETDKLSRLAETAGLSGYLAVAIIAAVLAIALLIGTSAAAAVRQRTETLALTIAGLSRSSIISARATAAITRLALAGVVALAAGLVTAHLAADLIPEAPPHAVPHPLLPLPILPAVVAVVITLVPAIIAELILARYAAKRADSASLRAVLT